jgi:peptidoglycan/xylan/chitin deacetylase (PgdA/CDA1 family)
MWRVRRSERACLYADSHEREGPAEGIAVTPVRRACEALLRRDGVGRCVRALARLRGHDLVLVYHRLGGFVPEHCEVVPSVPTRLFRAHLQALGEAVELVPLDQLFDPGSLRAARGPRVAVTFDDDLPSHVTEALPVLRELGVAATFFLSGRSLQGRGPYWFQQLEALVVAHGVETTAALLGKPNCGHEALLRAGQGDRHLRERVMELAAPLPAAEVLDAAGIAALAASGMSVGFHTIDHEAVPTLDDAGLAAAVSTGRDDLARLAGRPLRYFAYPYGKADARGALAVRRAGFEAAFTGAARPIRPGDNRFLLGRWEPGPIDVDALMMKLSIRLHRASPVLRQAAT